MRGATFLLLLTLGPALAGCAPAPPPPPGPVVLVTLAGLRADAASIGGPTPEIDALAAAASWSGTAVVASSDPLLALAALQTGVRPALDRRRAEPDVGAAYRPTLARLFAAAGYRTLAIGPRPLHAPAAGLSDGFAETSAKTSSPSLPATLAALDRRSFLWLHLQEGDVAFRRGRRSAGPRLDLRQPGAGGDPEAPMPNEVREGLRDAYRKAVQRVDRKLGETLDALRRNPSWHDAVVVVCGSRGTELGERRQVLAGESLDREAVEVPLWIVLPARLGPTPAEPSGARVAQIRVFSTLLEAAGIERRDPLDPPSLFRRSTAPILSELYEGNGVNRFSLLAGDVQLLWTSRFAPAEADYYRPSASRAGGGLRRLRQEFLEVPPLTGLAGEPPQTRLERWLADGRTAPVDDAALEARLRDQLIRRFRRFVPRELPPARHLQ